MKQLTSGELSHSLYIPHRHVRARDLHSKAVSLDCSLVLRLVFEHLVPRWQFNLETLGGGVLLEDVGHWAGVF